MSSLVLTLCWGVIHVIGTNTHTHCPQVEGLFDILYVPGTLFWWRQFSAGEALRVPLHDMSHFLRLAEVAQRVVGVQKPAVDYIVQIPHNTATTFSFLTIMVHQPNNSNPPLVDEACMLSDGNDDVPLSEISTDNFSRSRLSVSGTSLLDEGSRQEVFRKVQLSRAKELHISAVSSANDMTQLLDMARQNPNIGQVELVSCRLTSQHFGLLPAATKLVSCEATTEEDALPTCCTSNTQLTQLHLQDMLLPTSMVHAMQSFGNFPSLQSFRLTACHLTEETYQALSTLLGETSGQLQSVGIDLRVWSDVAVTSSGLAQAIGTHESIQELRLNGRILEQVSPDTMLALCGSSSQRRLRLTYRPTELQRFGGQLNQLAETTENLHAIDIAEFGRVSSLSVADYDTTLSTFITAVAKSTAIRSLALPALSKSMSQHLAESLSHNESLIQVASPSIAWTPALSQVLRQRSNLHVVHLVTEEERQQQQHELVVPAHSVPTGVNHQLPQLQDLDRCSLTLSTRNQEEDDTSKLQLKSTVLSKGNKNDLLNTMCTLKPTAKRHDTSPHSSKPCPVLDSPEYQHPRIAP